MSYGHEFKVRDLGTRRMMFRTKGINNGNE